MQAAQVISLFFSFLAAFVASIDVFKFQSKWREIVEAETMMRYGFNPKKIEILVGKELDKHVSFFLFLLSFLINLFSEKINNWLIGANISTILGYLMFFGLSGFVLLYVFFFKKKLVSRIIGNITKNFENELYASYKKN